MVSGIIDRPRQAFARVVDFVLETYDYAAVVLVLGSKLNELVRMVEVAERSTTV